MDKKAELKCIIEAFENGKEDLQATLNKINQLTGKNIQAHEVVEYWTYTSLDEFCNNLLTEPITNWEEIDDTGALYLIKEILANITNDSIINRISDALEKRYMKTPGFISDLIFHSDITDGTVILERLKKDTTIYL